MFEVKGGPLLTEKLHQSRESWNYQHWRVEAGVPPACSKKKEVRQGRIKENPTARNGEAGPKRPRVSAGRELRGYRGSTIKEKRPSERNHEGRKVLRTVDIAVVWES